MVNNMNNRILAIGPVTKDYIITPTDKYFQIGGAVFYQTLTLNSLKYNVTSIISMSEDDTKFLGDIRSQIKYVFCDKTMEYTNIYDENFTRRQKAKLNKNPILPESINIPLDNISSTLLSPLSPYDIPPETIDYLKENEIKTVLIPQGYLRCTDHKGNVVKRKWKNKSDYLKNTDIISLDENEAKTAFDLKFIKDEIILDLLEKYELEQIIITKAERGSTIYTKESVCNIPAIKTEHTVDATGLGDTYIAAYIARLEETGNIFESGLFASMSAKEKLENKGPLKCCKEKIEIELDKYR